MCICLIARGLSGRETLSDRMFSMSRYAKETRNTKWCQAFACMCKMPAYALDIPVSIAPVM